MQPANFSKFFFKSKNKVFGPVQIPKTSFYLFFSSISRGLSTKGEKVGFFGFSTDTKGEFRIFEE
jgi:hypothetical protein